MLNLKTATADSKTDLLAANWKFLEGLGSHVKMSLLSSIPLFWLVGNCYKFCRT